MVEHQHLQLAQLGLPEAMGGFVLKFLERNSSANVMMQKDSQRDYVENKW
jgi:hypothetical protein